jgi:hypothetical protein
VEVIDPAKRDDRLLQLLQKHHSSRKNRIIIFVLYKKEAPRVEGLLKRKGWNAAAIHGDISQGQRTAAVEAFKAGTVPLLIATDVAARGLDIPDVEVGPACWEGGAPGSGRGKGLAVGPGAVSSPAHWFSAVLIPSPISHNPPP